MEQKCIIFGGKAPPPKLLVFGGRGFIGTDFIEYIKEQIEYIKEQEQKKEEIMPIIIIPQFAYQNQKKVEETIIQHNPTNVICLSGRTHGMNCNTIDFLENELDLNTRDNLYVPVVIAQICAKYNIHYTYFGTGCIYNFDEKHTEENKVGFTEEDEPNYIGSAYSTIKGYTDRLMNNMINQGFPILNLRIRLPVVREHSPTQTFSQSTNTTNTTNTMHPRSFLTKILKYNKICSIRNSISVLPTLYPIIYKMIKEHVVGTFNCVNPNPLKHSEILEICGRGHVWNEMEQSEKEKMMKKRANNILDCTKLQKYAKSVNMEIPDTRSSLLRALCPLRMA